MSPSRGLEIRGLRISWANRPVLSDISAEVGPGEFVTLLGPNGSGKSTLLRAIAGFEPISAGSVSLDGGYLEAIPVHRRGIGLLFQDPVLIPRRTVWENVAFGPQVQGSGEREVRDRVERSLRLLRLEPLANRPAEALSGGERQRVALARTIAARPRLVLLDEPFASVDPELRSELRAEFRRALALEGIAALHVTHDREEAFFLGDRVLVLLEGRIVQAGRPTEVFQAPATRAIARFLGYNIARAAGGWVAFLPSDAEVFVAEGADRRATVLASGTGGSGSITFVESDSGDRWEIRSASSERPEPGSVVGVRWTRTVSVAP